MKIKRLHDKLYLESNRYTKPKESSKMLLKILKKKKFKSNKIKILDIGCANGELIYYLKKNLNNKVEFYGFDIRSDLLKAQKNCPMYISKKLILTKKLKLIINLIL